MTTTEILTVIDSEISRLQRAREVLAPTASLPSYKKSVGRPKGSKLVSPRTGKKRIISAEGKARIAAAQKKRWAAARSAGN